jgi:hypothetical protein
MTLRLGRFPPQPVQIPSDEWVNGINYLPAGVYPPTVGQTPPPGPAFQTIFYNAANQDQPFFFGVTGTLSADTSPGSQIAVKNFFLYRIFWPTAGNLNEIYRGYLDLSVRRTVSVPWVLGKPYQVNCLCANAYAPIDYFNTPMNWSYSNIVVINSTVPTTDVAWPSIQAFGYVPTITKPATNNGYPSMP